MARWKHTVLKDGGPPACQSTITQASAPRSRENKTRMLQGPRSQSIATHKQQQRRRTATRQTRHAVLRYATSHHQKKTIRRRRDRRTRGAAKGPKPGREGRVVTYVLAEWVMYILIGVDGGSWGRGGHKVRGREREGEGRGDEGRRGIRRGVECVAYTARGRRRGTIAGWA